MSYIGSSWEYSNLVTKNGLLAWYAADADDSAAALTDLSGNGRHLTAAATAPTRSATGAPNSKPAIVWNGSAEPLKTASSADFTYKTALILASFNASTFSDYQGLFGGQTATDESTGLLSSNSGTKFYDNPSVTYNFYKNGVYFGAAAREAPVGGAWGLLEISALAGGWNTGGLQFGQDRTFTARKLTGKIAEAFVWSGVLTESERLAMVRYFAGKYQIFPETAAGLKIFPFPADWSAPATIDKSVLFSRSVSGAVKQRVRYPAVKQALECGFTIRRSTEFDAARAFWSEHYGVKSFIYRNWGFDPARDIEAYFTSPIDFQADAYQNLGFSFSVIEK